MLRINFKQWKAKAGYRLVNPSACKVNVREQCLAITHPVRADVWTFDEEHKEESTVLLLEKDPAVGKKPEEVWEAVDFTKTAVRLLPIFAEIKTPEQVLAFANQYGALCLDVQPDGQGGIRNTRRNSITSIPGTADSPIHSQPFMAEQLGEWFQYARAMREYWTAIQAMQALLDEKGIRFMDAEDKKKILADNELRNRLWDAVYAPFGMKRWRVKTEEESPIAFIESNINHQTSGHISVIYDQGAYRFWANDLPTVFFAALARCAAGVNWIKRCGNPECKCGTPESQCPGKVIIGEHASRRDADYCCASCKNAYDYKTRKEVRHG